MERPETGTAARQTPLSVGKAANTLASRDVEGHFGIRERGAQSPSDPDYIAASKGHFEDSAILEARAAKPKVR